MSLSRRDLLQALAAAGALLPAAHALHAAPLARPAQPASPSTPAARAASAGAMPDHDMRDMPASWMGSERVAMLLYPGFTALDFVGPQYMFGNLMGAEVQLVARTRDPVMSDTRLAIVPTATYADCADALDLLFVPGGGNGTLDAMEDSALLAFIAARGAHAARVASVCTGSLLLGAAGLLTGYRATSHWVTRALLPAFGATAVDARVVVDRNRWTGAGVSAGLDLGLALVADMRDASFAQAVQLLAEYAPQPPFNAGTPDAAPAQVRAHIDGMFDGYRARVRQIAAERTGATAAAPSASDGEGAARAPMNADLPSATPGLNAPSPPPSSTRPAEEALNVPPRRAN